MPFMTSSMEEIQSIIENRQITLSVIGLGRTGLPTAALFASAGFQVLGVDINKKLVELLNQGRITLDEPGLADLVETSIKNGKLRGILQVDDGYPESDIFIICVPTPILENKVPDYSSIIQAMEKIKVSLKKGVLIIIESTVSPGTVENLLIPILEKDTRMKVREDFWIVSCPERANPGEILKIFQSTPRIIGGIDQKSTDVATFLYKEIMKAEIIKVSNPKTANAVKLTENIFRDVNIALINELSILYEKLGIDTFEIIQAAATKWNFVPHYPGAGVGGPCLPANPYYLIQEGVKVGYVPHLIRIAREINDRMPSRVVELVLDALNEAQKTVKNATISILGISYKANLRDARISPFFPIYHALQDRRARLKVYDPYFSDSKEFSFPVESSLNAAIEDTDCIVIVTDHEEFKDLDLKDLKKLVKTPLIIVDGRNVLANKDIPPGTIICSVGKMKKIT